MRNNIQSICVLAVVALFASTSVLSAKSVSVNMQLDPPDPANKLDLTLIAEALGMSPDDSDTSYLTGNVPADLQIVFDPNTHDVNQVTGLEFTGGTINLSNTDFTLNFGILGSINAAGSGISGTLDTPDLPQPVSGTTFNASQHQLILNSGQFYFTGSGMIGGTFEPFTLDLSTDPVVTTNTGTGSILISLLSVDGDTATYDITLTMPIDFSEQIYSDPTIILTLAGAGTLVAQGQFSRCTLRADLTGDCHVYWEDLVEFFRQWLAYDESWPCPWTADFTDDDCHVDLLDFAILYNEWLL